MTSISHVMGVRVYGGEQGMYKKKIAARMKVLSSHTVSAVLRASFQGQRQTQVGWKQIRVAENHPVRFCQLQIC